MLNNEEDVKNKLVVPYLRSLGFDESELFYERSFDLKVGRYTYRVDTDKQIHTAQPRLDIGHVVEGDYPPIRSGDQ